MEALESFEHAGCTILLYPDWDAMPPSDWDTLGTLYRVSGDSYTCMEDAGYNVREIMERRGVRGMLRYLSLFEGVTALPVDVLDYGSSGVLIREAHERDDDCSAYLGTTKKRADELGVPHDKILEGLRAELEQWRAYFEGNVVGYVVLAGTLPTWAMSEKMQEAYLRQLETVDSCWGFYPESTGDGFDYVREEARYAAEWEANQREHAASLGIPTIGEER